MDAILEWLATFILNWLFQKAQMKVQQAAAQAKTDQERGVINDANTKAYEEAKSRADARAAALKLLNRVQ